MTCNNMKRVMAQFRDWFKKNLADVPHYGEIYDVNCKCTDGGYTLLVTFGKSWPKCLRGGTLCREFCVYDLLASEYFDDGTVKYSFNPEVAEKQVQCKIRDVGCLHFDNDRKLSAYNSYVTIKGISNIQAYIMTFYEIANRMEYIQRLIKE